MFIYSLFQKIFFRKRIEKLEKEVRNMKTRNDRIRFENDRVKSDVMWLTEQTDQQSEVNIINIS